MYVSLSFKLVIVSKTIAVIWTVNKLDIQIVFQDKLKFYLPESLLYKINNPDAEFLIHIGIVLLVIVLIVLLIGDQI